MQFCDQCQLIVKAGDGGNGVVSWRREAHYPEGGPFGGDGGYGGSVIIIGDHNLNSLFHLRYLRTVNAENGENGKTKNCTGKNGNNKIIKVPLGTSIYDTNTNNLIKDILIDGEQFVVCYGGKGGYGNTHFKSSINKAPTLYENGDLGEQKSITLKLKYIADVGIIGLPNAGKSTLISAISSASPKIANYQFTTLYPVLGTWTINNKKIVFADIPGLIDGASDGKGLGHEFLKHIERCHLLIHLISMSPEDNENIIKAYETITYELKKYNKELLNKQIIVVANKSDVLDSNINYQKICNFLNKDIIFISAKNKENLDKLLSYVYDAYLAHHNNLEQNNDKEQIEIIKLNKKEEQNMDVKITQLDEHTWNIESEWLKYWAHKIPLTTKDNIYRFNQKLQSLDGENKAKNMGAKPGDTLIIYDNEFIIDK